MPRKKAEDVPLPIPPQIPSAETAAMASAKLAALDLARLEVARSFHHESANASTIFHKKAICRWCKGRFRVGDTPRAGTWLCERDECAQRQLTYAQRYDEADLESPVIYVPTPFGVDFEESAQKNVLGGGSAGVSKSHTLRWHCYRWCRRIPGYESILIRQSFPELESTHLLRMFREQTLMKGAKYRNGDRQMSFHADGDSFVKAGHCESESDMVKYLSTEYDGVNFDEASTIKPRPLREISSRARSDAARPEVRARGGGWARYTTNPGGISALYLKSLFITRDPDPMQVKRYHPDHYGTVLGTIEDNPYLEDDYEEARLDTLDPDRYEQLRHGNWDVASGQFFATFDMSKHVINLEIPV